MKKKVVPKFFAEIKKDRANKTFEDVTVKRLNCPMDIMADIIDKNVIRYSDRLKHKALRTLLNHNVKGKGNRQKRNKVIELAEEYKKYVDWINLNKESMDDSTLLAVRNRAIDRFLNKANNNLDQETVMLLVSYAVWEGNSDISTTILNFLYRTNKEKFLNCFIKR
jgi:stress response protein SCP2